jgi:hypothetical protein
MTQVMVMLILLALPLAGSAQGVKERLAEIQRTNAAVNRVHMVMNIEVFQSNESATPFYKERAEIKRDLDNLRTNFSGIEMLKNEKCLVMINRNQKQILYTKRTPETEKQYNLPMGFDLDSLIRTQEVPVLVNSEGSVDQLRFKQRIGPIGTLDLFIDSQNHINRMDYFYNTGQHVIIRFEVFNTEPVFDSTVFFENNFIVVEKGKVRPSDQYANFIVIVN